MTVKKVKKNVRQKKILKVVKEAHANDMGNFEAQNIIHEEDAIRRQFLAIKKDYSRLVTDVATGYEMIVDWVGLQASSKGEQIKTRFIKN